MEEFKSAFIDSETWRFVVGFILFVCSLFLFVSFASYIVTGQVDQSWIEAGSSDIAPANHCGTIGAFAGYFFMDRGFGLFAFLIPLFVLAFSIKLIGVCKVRLWKWFVNCGILMILGSLALTFLQPYLQSFIGDWIVNGGNHGEYVNNQLSGAVGTIGTGLIIFLLSILYLAYLSSETISIFRKLLTPGTYKLRRKEETEQSGEENDVADNVIDRRNIPKEEERAKTIDLTLPQDNEEPEFVEPIEDIDPQEEEIDFRVGETVENEQAEGKDVANPLEAQGPYDPRLDLAHYKFPTLSLLKKYDSEDSQVDNEEHMKNRSRIVNALRDFGVEITNIYATPGPTVTLYEITPAQNVRINKIKSLSEDIALRLSAVGVRIIAPIPGKGTVGIEVPNEKPQIVSMESLLNSKKFQETTMALPVALGKTITNEIFMVDLAKMPHMLVAGATGQGKSVGLNAVITSLLYKKHPSEMKIVLVDPKKVEFSMYEGLEKHFLAKMPTVDDPIITDTSQVVHTLKSLCVLMDHRYDLLKKARCKTIKEYNDKFCRRLLNPENGHEYLPYIVIIIDEFGDLIMTAGKEVELPIQRITQLARAVGMHMVLATQRPTTNIITGTIKANCPARIAFRVSSMIDSRTILDRPGANQLVGKGDMLFLNGMEPVRVQCAFVDTPEIERIVEYVHEQQGYLGAFELPEVLDEQEEAVGVAPTGGERDPMFQQVAEYVVVHQQGSTSLIQRKFAIGYNKAGRIMDQLEAAGIVGPTRGSKPREVLIMDLDSLNKIIGG